ncbi:hypothetical protein P278_19440 [Zhouia amylolytica AD3]|uniref:Uncharacterized protein n=1 Tax=Zhouia amylolytica AD3 TaxID=1286632 RepID=W2UMK0_9FLAO|nr:hypothetical protein P278_19440 [Zhouia amylolytica AD3]
MAIWAAGPPNATHPNLKNTLATSLNLDWCFIIISTTTAIAA